MKEVLTRRDLLKAGAGLGLALATPELVKAHEYYGIEPLEYVTPPRNIERVGTFATKVAEAMHEIQPFIPQIENMRDVENFRDEFVPYLNLVGFVKEENLLYPKITTGDFGKEIAVPGGFFIMGYSECVIDPYSTEMPSGDIKINKRFFDKYSAMNRPDENPAHVATIAHEICHSNQTSCAPSFFGIDSSMVEGTTNIAAINALSAMAMDGSPLALPAALSLVGYLAKSYVLVELNKEGRVDDYEQFLHWFPNHSEELGDFNLMKTFGLEGVIGAAENYGHRPLEVLSEAMVTPNYETKPLSVLTDSGTLLLPHTAYVLDNLSHFIYDYKNQ